MLKENYNQKDIKYMLLAKQYGELFATCLSRKIGALIVKNDRVIAAGVNGPPAHVQHTQYKYHKSADYEQDHKIVYGIGWFYSEILKKWIFINTEENESDYYPYYLDEDNHKTIFSGSYKILSELQKESIQDPNFNKQKLVIKKENEEKGEILKVSDDLICPRKLFEYKSGLHLGICNCCHGEENAIVSASLIGTPVKDATLYTYSPHPCDSCSRMIINSGISKIVCIDDKYNSFQSEQMIKEALIKTIKIPLEKIFIK